MEPKSRNHLFGMEIEGTGIPRYRVAYLITRELNGTGHPWRTYNGYNNYRITDSEGKRWDVKLDSSINPQRLNNHQQIVSGTDDHQFEVITPPLQYDKDIEKLLRVVRTMKAAGAFVNDTCASTFTSTAENILPLR